MDEEILEVVELLDENALYITSNRLIFAHLGAKDLYQTLGLATIGGAGMAVGKLFDRHKRDKKVETLSKLSSESILMAHKKNFAIPYTEVTEVEMCIGTASKWFQDQTFRILTGSRKCDFKLGSGDDFDNCLNAIKSLLGNKLTIS